MPGDISSAAPFLVAAALLPGSHLTVHDVGLNPRRTGLLDVLERMGARVAVHARRRVAGEQIGDVEIVAQPLVATKIEADEVPLLVDELPLFGLLAACAHGKSYVNGAEELRVKESDRIEAVVDALRAIGAARARDERTASPSPACRPGRAAAGSTRAATTASRCSARSPASSRARACGSRAPKRAAISFPGFYDVLADLAVTGEIG